MTSNISIELDCAKAILKTYQQVNDTSYAQRKHSRTHRSKTEPAIATKPNKAKAKTLEFELTELQQKYSILLNELNSKEEMLARLNRQLQDRTTHLEQLQEDFENVIYQFNHKLTQSTPSINAFE